MKDGAGCCPAGMASPGDLRSHLCCKNAPWMPVISLFSLLFGVFNNNFKVFVFIGFVIIYFYNIFALIKKLFKFLSKMLFTLASRSACLFMPFFACFSLFRSYIARYAPLKNKKTF